jgi:hypothetical protein
MMNAFTVNLVLLVLCLVLHLVEEVLTGFRRKLPIGEMSLPVFIGINLLIYIFIAIMLAAHYLGLSASIILVWIFAIGMLINGAGHIFWMLHKRRYFPGGFTAIPLVFLSISLISMLATAGT